jgi:hypothetical protein
MTDYLKFEIAVACTVRHEPPKLQLPERNTKNDMYRYDIQLYHTVLTPLQLEFPGEGPWSALWYHMVASRW